MKSLADLFLSHAIPGVREAHIRHVIAEKATNLLKIPIKPKQVSFKEGVLILAVPPVVKSILILKAEELKSQLQVEGIVVTTIK